MALRLLTVSLDLNLDLFKYTAEKTVSQRHVLLERHMSCSSIREGSVKLEGGRIRHDGYVRMS